MKRAVPPIGLARWGEFVGAVVHEMTEVFPDFGDVLDVGIGGFVAVDPEAVFLVEGAILAPWGERKGIACAEGRTTKFGAPENTSDSIWPFECD